MSIEHFNESICLMLYLNAVILGGLTTIDNHWNDDEQYEVGVYNHTPNYQKKHRDSVPVDLTSLLLCEVD